MLNNCIRQAKKSFYMTQFTNLKNDTRKIWSTTNQLFNNKKDNATCHILSNGKKPLGSLRNCRSIQQNFRPILHPI